MNFTYIFFLTTVLIGLPLLVYLIFLLRKMILKQVENQFIDMIPVKAVRKRIAIKIKWKN